jgi:tRNA A37 threonylcarbamoyladenosine synthetase subunit TsaC/SUA5/YrdC
MPNHWIGEFANYFDTPLVTTSANRSGETFMRHLDDLDSEIQKGCEFVVYEGVLERRPSTIVKLTEEKPVIKER